MQVLVCTNSFKTTYQEKKLNSLFNIEHSELKDLAHTMRDCASKKKKKKKKLKN